MQDPSPSVILDVDLDPSTRNRVSFTGLDCRIIGTFYEDSRDGKVILEFGHDVDNFYATATYRVFKPVGNGLSAIASYIKPTDDPVEMVRVGAVRYSSTPLGPTGWSCRRVRSTPGTRLRRAPVQLSGHGAIAALVGDGEHDGPVRVSEYLLPVDRLWSVPAVPVPEPVVDPPDHLLRLLGRLPVRLDDR